MASPKADSQDYLAFISYSHTDDALASMIHRWLESYRLPRKLVGRNTSFGRVPGRLAPVFRDREELPTSDDLGAQIKIALQRSRTLVVVCSPRSAQSRWVNEEILSYKRLQKNRIMCVIIDGEPNAADRGRPDEECFAPALRFDLDHEGQLTPVRSEPIAADMREGKDGKRDALLKLVAGIIDVGFDELKQRHKKQVFRSRIHLALSSIAVLSLIGGSLWSYAESRMQRAQAIRAKQAAEERENAAAAQTQMATLLLGQYLDAAKAKISLELSRFFKESYEEFPLGAGDQKLGVGIKYHVDVGAIADLSSSPTGSEHSLAGSLPVTITATIEIGAKSDPPQLVTATEEILSFNCDATYSAQTATWDIAVPAQIGGTAEALAKVRGMADKVLDEYLSAKGRPVASERLQIHN